jgi:hypothetical protein
LNKNNQAKSEEKNQQKSVEIPRRNSPRLKAKQAATVNDGTTKKGISVLKGPITKYTLREQFMEEVNDLFFLFTGTCSRDILATVFFPDIYNNKHINCI